MAERGPSGAGVGRGVSLSIGGGAARFSGGERSAATAVLSRSIPRVSSLGSESVSRPKLTIISGKNQNPGLDKSIFRMPEYRPNIVRHAGSPAEQSGGGKSVISKAKLAKAFPGTVPFISNFPNKENGGSSKPLTSDGLRSLLNQPSYGTSESTPNPINTAVRVTHVGDKVPSNIERFSLPIKQLTEQKKVEVRKEIGAIQKEQAAIVEAATRNVAHEPTIVSAKESVRTLLTVTLATPLPHSGPRTLAAEFGDLLKRKEEAKAALQYDADRKKTIGLMKATMPVDTELVVEKNETRTRFALIKSRSLGLPVLEELLEKRKKKKQNEVIMQATKTVATVAGKQVELQTKPDRLIQTVSQPAVKQETQVQTIPELHVQVDPSLEIASGTETEIIPTIKKAEETVIYRVNTDLEMRNDESKQPVKKKRFRVHKEALLKRLEQWRTAVASAFPLFDFYFRLPLREVAQRLEPENESTKSALASVLNIEDGSEPEWRNPLLTNEALVTRGEASLIGYSAIVGAPPVAEREAQGQPVGKKDVDRVIRGKQKDYGLAA